MRTTTMKALKFGALGSGVLRRAPLSAVVLAAIRPCSKSILEARNVSKFAVYDNRKEVHTSS